MIQRALAIQIKKLAGLYPIVALTGPRQSGKTTLLVNMFPEYRYVSLENPDNLSFAVNDPNGFLELYSENVIFDEVQRAPELFSFLQTWVDKSGKMGQFILSGSQNFHLMKNISQSLAGRVALFRLLPLDFIELKAEGLLPMDFSEMLIRGNYPALFDRPIPTTDFYANYVETYVERDVSILLNIRDLSLFRNFLRLCAARSGQLLNLAELSRDAAISVPTARAWLSILESSYLVYQIPPYYRNFSKRLVKSPKLYFYDTGLLCYLLGIKTAEQLHLNEHKGAIFENFIINEYKRQNFHQNLHREFYFWRDSNGIEVDLLVGGDSPAFDLVEIKASKTIIQKMFNNLDVVERLAGNFSNRKIMVYAGGQSQRRTDYQIWSWQDVRLTF
ncbi:MAG: ATP-binding protein [Saprospiraceae bacterium]|nr:ATP-binding protein [Saprospiraceae bacterium]